MKFDSKIVQRLVLIRTLCSDGRGRRQTAVKKISGILLFIFILSGFSALRCEATVYQSNGSEANIQSIHDTQAQDGDTITLPAGTFTWTSALNITKGITLQGQTTISGAGTANPIINDGTIIRDDTLPRGLSNYIIAARMATSAQSFRLTGITFRPGTTTTVGHAPIRLRSDVENKNMRVDHCHFDHLYQTRCIWVNGWCEGVADHNVMRKRTGIGGTEAFLIQSGKYGNDSEALGNVSFADYPWYGTDKFFFIEDNTIEFGAATDSSQGARFVYRHNYNINAVVTDHGTESPYGRGQRAKEVYNNTFHWTKPNPKPSGGQRGGTSLWHDNHITGNANIGNNLCNLVNNRETFIYATPFWGIADGTGPWDANDTGGNGTFIEGHPPYLFAMGRATGGTVTFGAKATFTDSTKNWTPNRWTGYSIKKVGATASYGSYIIGNGAHSITYAYVASTRC